MPQKFSPLFLGWLIALAFFAVCGAAGFWKFFTPATSPPGVDASTDAILEQALHMTDGTRLLRDSTRGVPAAQPAIVFGPGDDWTFSGVYFAASCALWPRPVWALGTDAEKSDTPNFTNMPKDDVQARALIFYRSEPPPELRPLAKTLVENLRVVILPEAGQ